MKAASTLIMYLIVLLFNFHGILGEALLMDFVDSQLSAPTPCNFSSDCHHLKNADCMNNYCNCNGTKFCVSNLEQRLLKLGQKCESSSDCLIENSVCQERKCRCIEGTAADIDGRKCIKGEKSKLNANNQCGNEGCQCEAGYVSNYASTECLKIVEELNSACDEDVQCISKFENSICHEGRCRCNESYEYDAIDNMCVKDLSSRVGSLNETDSRTPTGCVDGICKEQEVELSLKADNPCIGGLCDGFQKEQKIGCTVGRCECPEERQFCTNGAELRTQTNKKRRVKKDSTIIDFGDHPKVVAISPTIIIASIERGFDKVKEYFGPLSGSFAVHVTLAIFGCTIQTLCAYSKWRGTAVFFLLIFLLNYWMLCLVYQLELFEVALIFFSVAVMPCFGFLFFIALFAILKRCGPMYRVKFETTLLAAYSRLVLSRYSNIGFLNSSPSVMKIVIMDDKQGKEREAINNERIRNLKPSRANLVSTAGTALSVIILTTSFYFIYVSTDWTYMYWVVIPMLLILAFDEYVAYQTYGNFSALLEVNILFVAYVLVVISRYIYKRFCCIPPPPQPARRDSDERELRELRELFRRYEERNFNHHLPGAA